MKKVLLIPIALLCSLLFIIGLDFSWKARIDRNVDKAIYYNNIYTRNNSDFVMEKVISEDSIVVLGSSELSASDDLAFPMALLNKGYSDFNIILMGAGYFQSIPQAVNVGALQNNIKNGKVVLILSPQWFTPAGLTSDAYCSRFEEANFIEFLRNKSITKQTKTAVASRINELLASDPTTLERVRKDEQIYLSHSLDPFVNVEMRFYNLFREIKLRYDIKKEFETLTSGIDYDHYVTAESIDWALLLQNAEALGEKACTTNEFGIYDEYYKKYIESKYDTLKGSYASSSYISSPEFQDFRLFLDVCKETGIEPLIISVPVNGRWYDYCGFPKADRNTYYQIIRGICAEYDVKLVDFSDKEYELFFLKDIMHMGWKGWAYLDRAVYSFYKNEELADDTLYERIEPTDISVSEGVSAISDHSYSFSTEVEGNRFNCVVVNLPDDNTVLDSTGIAEHRSGTYLHTRETGPCVIKLRANSNLQDEYISLTFFLEKDGVYKLEYDVNSIEDDLLTVSNFSISKINF